MQTREEGPLSGTVTLVTGGSREFGAATAMAFTYVLASRDAGIITGPSVAVDGGYVA